MNIKLFIRIGYCEVVQVKWPIKKVSPGYPHAVMEQANHNQINQNRAYIIDKVSIVLRIPAQHSIVSLYHGYNINYIGQYAL